MYTQKDLIRVQSIVSKLATKVTFNGLSTVDIVHLKADFEWLEALKTTIGNALIQQQDNLRKAQLEAAAQEKAERQLAVADTITEEVTEEAELSEDPPKVKKQTKKKTSKKVSDKKSKKKK